MARRQVVKTLGHLLDVRKHLLLALEHTKLMGSTNPTTEAVEQNVSALFDGVQETVALCGQAAEQIKNEMQDPNATPPPIKGNMGIDLTPFQRALIREGVEFETMPKYVPTEREKKLPRILPFNLQKRKKQNRLRTNKNIPL